VTSACLQEGLFIGAAVTQATLIDYLLEVGSKSHKKGSKTNGTQVEKDDLHGGTTGVYKALAHHLQRIAGNPVPFCLLF